MAVDKIIVVYTQNNLFVGNLHKVYNNNDLELSNVLTINTSIRDDKSLNFGTVNFIKKNQNTIFKNYILYSEADDKISKLYNDFLESE